MRSPTLSGWHCATPWPSRASRWAGGRRAPSKHGFVDYSRAQFAYDFFEFVHRQRRDYKGIKAFGHVATKSQAESADKSIWIVEGDGPHDGRYIADLVFSKDE